MNNFKKMLKATIFFFLISISIDCGGQEQLKTDLLMEVTVKSFGQVTFQGEILLLRLYDNAEAEADILSLRTKKETQFKRKTFSLSETDFREIQKLLRVLERTDFKKNYSRNAPASDLYSITTIIFSGTENQKIEIVMEENATGILIDEYGEKYPKPIVALLSNIYKLRQQFE